MSDQSQRDEATERIKHANLPNPVFAACSGAVTGDFYVTNPAHTSEPAQISRLSVANPNAVTMTIGGDVVAQITGRSTTEEICLALEHWIEKTKSDPATLQKAEAVRAEIERNAQTQRNAIASTFGGDGAATDDAKEARPTASSTRVTFELSGSGDAKRREPTWTRLTSLSGWAPAYFRPTIPVCVTSGRLLFLLLTRLG